MSYNKWKNGGKVTKASWVIEYYKSVTDENQYRLGLKVRNRLLLVLCPMVFILGIYFGWVMWG